MARVRIEPGRSTLSLAAGERLLDALDEAGEHPIALSCRDASCGSCRVAIVAGVEALELAASDERGTLASLAVRSDERLACRLRARADAGSIVIVLALRAARAGRS